MLGQLYFPVYDSFLSLLNSDFLDESFTNLIDFNPQSFHIKSNAKDSNISPLMSSLSYIFPCIISVFSLQSRVKEMDDLLDLERDARIRVSFLKAFISLSHWLKILAFNECTSSTCTAQQLRSCNLHVAVLLFNFLMHFPGWTSCQWADLSNGLYARKIRRVDLFTLLKCEL